MCADVVVMAVLFHTNALENASLCLKNHCTIETWENWYATSDNVVISYQCTFYINGDQTNTEMPR